MTDKEIKIVGVQVMVETSPGILRPKIMDFKEFLAHVDAATRGMGYWSEEACSKYKALGANPKNYE